MDVDLPQPPCREHHDAGRESVHAPPDAVQGICAPAVDVVRVDDPFLRRVVLRDQLDGDMVLKCRYRWILGDRLHQRPLDLPPRQVIGMDNPVYGVPPFPPQVERPVPVRETDAHLDQIPEALGSFPHHDLDCVAVRQPHPGGERVPDMKVKRIHRGHHGRDTPLRIVGVRLGLLLFRDDGHRPVPRGLQRVRESCDPAADDQKIVPVNHAALSGWVEEKKSAVPPPAFVSVLS